MKSLKLFCIFAVGLIALSIASCDDIEDSISSSNTTTFYAVCKFKYSLGTYYFETQDGFLIYPSSSSISDLSSSSSSTTLSDLIGDVVMLVYAVELDSDTDYSTSISDVTVYSIISMQDDFELVEYEGADNDSIENAPIISLSESSAVPYFFDEETLVLPINHYIESYTHYTTLVYYPNDDEDLTDGVVTLYLRHNTGSDSSSVTSSSSTTFDYADSSYYYWYLYFNAFDISPVFDYESPTTINVVYQQSTSLSLSAAVETTYSIDYSY